FPIFCRLWLMWCKKGPRRREYGTVGGNLFLKCLFSYYRAFPSGQDNLVPITFSQIETDVFMDIVDKETYQHSVPVLSNGSTEIDLLKILLEIGDTFIDVGANIGTLSLHGAKLVGKNGRVVAVEPQPRLAEALRMTKNRNKLDQLDVIEAAAGESDGQV